MEQREYFIIRRVYKESENRTAVNAVKQADEAENWMLALWLKRNGTIILMVIFIVALNSKNTAISLQNTHQLRFVIIQWLPKPPNKKYKGHDLSVLYGLDFTSSINPFTSWSCNKDINKSVVLCLVLSTKCSPAICDLLSVSSFSKLVRMQL